MKKRISALLLTLCMCLTLLPMTVFADEGIAIDETDSPDANLFVYNADNCDSGESFETDENSSLFCESDESIIIDDSMERSTEQAGVELVPRNGNSTYGYYDLANKDNGTNMQRLYYSMYLDAEAFYNSTSDLDSSLRIGSYTISDYDLTLDEAIAVWKIFYQENPLYYWLSNTFVSSGDQMNICIDESYKLYDDRSACNESIKAMIDEFNESVSDSMSDLEIALAAHDFIVKRIDYAYEADGVTPQDDLWAHNIIGTAMKQYGVCESYAKTYMCLCLINDVDCIVVSGIGNNEDHMWNLVKIDEAWYGVDVTWDDTGTEELSYTCFGMSDSALNLSHTADSVTSSGIDYQYALPQVSEDSIQLVYLYKGEQYLGTYINIDAAFEAMTDKDAEYTIKLQTYTVQGPLLLAYMGVMHEIKSSITPEVKKIIICGKHIDLENDFFYSYPVVVDDSLMLKSDMDIVDLQLSVAGTLDLKGFTLSTYGYHCALFGNIIGDVTAESRSYINAYTSMRTDVHGTVNVFGVQCMAYGPRIMLYSSSNIQLASGCIVIDSGSSSNYFIKNYVVHADEPLGAIMITGRGTSVEIENIICGRAGYFNYVYIVNEFGKLEDFNHLRISGGTECRIEYNLFGEVTHVATDMEGNEVGRWVEQANPDDLTVPILNIGDPSILDYLTVIISNNLIDFDALYELLENGDIVRKKVDPQAQFTDAVPETHWAHDAIDYVLNRGIMHGMGDGTFAPNGTVTRAMVAVMLHNLSGEPEVSGDSPFTDVKLTDWYGEAVIWAYENKIVSGMGDGTFNPSGSITREQLAIMMQNYAAFIGKDTSGEDDLSRFEDAESVSFWAEDAVKWAVSAGIISGSDEGGKLYLLPQGDATRAQIAVIFESFCEKFEV